VKHPAQSHLALLSGADLGRWERWRIQRHVAHCGDCRRELDVLSGARAQLREWTSEMPELPNGLSWNRLAAEMTGNIHVGLAAGEAIAIFDRPVRGKPRLGWNAALAGLGAAAILCIAFWSGLPAPQTGHLMASLQRIRAGRIGTLLHSTAAVPSGEVMLEASSAGIRVSENGRAMSLLPHSDGATVSVSMHGSAGVRFVDADTGQVTTNKVYYAEQ
jgi:hypothetical protein